MLIQADALHVPLADGSVHACFTSPPYWLLRDYGTGEWVGGEANCGHFIKGDENLTSRKQTSNSGSIRVAKNRCSQCGATRIDKQLGLEANPDCLGWATGKRCGECYVCHLTAVFREVKRVLRDDGVLFLNLGDTYFGGKGQSGSQDKEFQQKRVETGVSFTSPAAHFGGRKKTKPNDGRHDILKPLDLCGIPWSVAKALQADGWFLRSSIIWKKPTSMPESVAGWRWERHRIKLGDGPKNKTKYLQGDAKRIVSNSNHKEPIWLTCPSCEKCKKHDGYVLIEGAWRPTRGHEYVFMLAKSGDYFCNAIKEPADYDGRNDTKMKGSDKYRNGFVPPQEAQNVHARGHERWQWENGIARRNPRSVYNPKFSLRRDLSPEAKHDLLEKIAHGEKFDLYDYFAPGDFEDVVSINSEPLRFGHYAAFPTQLPRKLLPAAISAKGCCAACGRQWARVVEKGFAEHNGKTTMKYKDGSNARRIAQLRQAAREKGFEYFAQNQTISWKAACDCDAGIVRPVVLDPFCGTGTVGIVARELGAHFVGLDLNLDYLRDFAQLRIDKRVSEKMIERGLKSLPLFEETNGK